jgi:ankyrin repeat protein
MHRLIAIALLTPSVWAADPAVIRDAATRAIAMLQKSQKTWYSRQSCFSCHQQVLPELAYRAARQHGIPVDETAAHASAAAAFKYYSRFDNAVDYLGIIDPAMSDGYLLAAAEAAGVKPNLTTAVYARLIGARQESDGHWDTVDVRPPQSYSPFTATAVAMQAVASYSRPSQSAVTKARLQKAGAWLQSHKAQSTEERTFQIIGLCLAQADAAVTKKLAMELKAGQQADGGWNSLDGRASDAYSTSQALFALVVSGAVPTSDAAWQRGVDYLLKTQAKDGSWHVESRLHPPAPVSPAYFETGHPYGHDQFISMMGGSWAVIALAEALGEAKHADPAPIKEAEPPAQEPWVETLLFGTTADVKKLLDGGFNPNSATASGGTTALMLAAPDVEKMKLLLERGANADARSKNRFSALLVAAVYPGSADAMNLLLDHGAKVRLPQGEGSAQFNFFPIFSAAYAGNTAIIPRLVKEGDKVDDKTIFIGMFPLTPLMSLVGTTRVAGVRALLDAGATLDQVDDGGITGLGWAAISNRVDMAKMLIERGADVNHVDKQGMTPLLYAASIDFGDSKMIDLLLASGAKPAAKTKDGLTALELARKYKHNHLIPSLEGPRASR